jgi:hypothetical protein
MFNANPGGFWGLLGLGVLAVMLGLVLKNAQPANTIMTGFSSAYGSVLSVLEKAA